MSDNVANKRTVLSLRRKAETISFLNELMTGTVYSMDDAEAPPWFSVGNIYRIDLTLYYYHAESGSVRWADGSRFVYANGMEPFQFFWNADDEFFGRQLSETETFRFCQSMNVKRYT